MRPGQKTVTRATLAELMAIPVNKSQQVLSEGFAPASAYSRIITVHAAAAGDGVWGFGFSPSFGKQARLLKVDATVQIKPNGELERSWFSIHRGSGVPRTHYDVRSWDKLIDFGSYGGTDGLLVRGQWRQFSWNMNRLFTTEANRFGVAFFNASSNVGSVYVFFEMSEG